MDEIRGSGRIPSGWGYKEACYIINYTSPHQDGGGGGRKKSPKGTLLLNLRTVIPSLTTKRYGQYYFTALLTRLVVLVQE